METGRKDGSTGYGTGVKYQKGMHEVANLAIGTTSGQSERLKILHESEKWLARPLRRNSITSSFVKILWILAAIDAAGVGMSLYLMHQKSTSITSTSPDQLRRPFF